jgi:hypothetical protein
VDAGILPALEVAVRHQFLLEVRLRSAAVSTAPPLISPTTLADGHDVAVANPRSPETLSDLAGETGAPRYPRNVGYLA